MALEVAAILDESALKPEWADASCSTLNSSLSKIKVKSGYSILVTIAERSYLLTSNARGVLSITMVPSGPTSEKAMARSQCRIVVDADALGQIEGPADLARMLAKRKMRFAGDATQLKNLEKDIGPHVNMLRESVEAAGPGSHVLKMAIDEHNRSLDEQKSELAAYDEYAMQLALGGDYSVEELPLIMTCRSWLLFSATSTLSGNMGQSNYCAANALLDQQTFCMRTTNGSAGFDAHTIMWGAVGGLGMRWKAFASQDFLNDMEVDILMTADEARQVLTYMVNGTGAEWTSAQKMQQMPDMTWLQSMMMFLGNPNDRRKNPWGWGQGRGGGLTMDDPAEVLFHNTPLSRTSGEQKTGGNKAHSWLSPGRRVRIHDLTTNAEMNGVKGTLVEETRAGVWHVSLDDQWGDKLLKVENLMQIHSSIAKQQPSAEAAKATSEGPPEKMCIAGNWNDWVPQDMQWDGDEKCHTFCTQMPGQAAYFGVNRGEAGLKPWRSGSFKKWCMGVISGSQLIKVYIKDCKVSEVKWEQCARV